MDWQIQMSIGIAAHVVYGQNFAVAIAAQRRLWVLSPRAAICPMAAPICLAMFGNGHIRYLRSILMLLTMAGKTNQVSIVASCGAVRSSTFGTSPAVRSAAVLVAVATTTVFVFVRLPHPISEI